jgi:hypothetical protein
MSIYWSLDYLERFLPSDRFANLSAAACDPAVPMDAGGSFPIIHGETGDLLASVP